MWNKIKTFFRAIHYRLYWFIKDIIYPRNVGYMCLTDYHCELGGVPVIICPSISSLKKACPCTKTCCGIVKVKIKFIKVIKEDNMMGDDGES